MEEFAQSVESSHRRARLRDRDKANLNRKLELFKAQQGLVETTTSQASSVEIKSEPIEDDNKEENSTTPVNEDVPLKDDTLAGEDTEMDLLDSCPRWIWLE